MPLTWVDLRENTERIRERVSAAALRAGRDPAAVTLIAVSKTHPAEVVVEALRAGLVHFGENRVQEAAEKIPEVARLAAHSNGRRPVWHLIGHLQTNKAKAAAQLFQTVDSVDSVRLATALGGRVDPAGEPLPVLLEVYLGDDPGRPGFRLGEVERAVEAVLAVPGISARGLMTVAPLGLDAAATRRVFRQVRELRDRLAAAYPRVDFHQLSMGMSEDFELAVEEGSTAVRIGRALFGPRETR